MHCIWLKKKSALPAYIEVVPGGGCPRSTQQVNSLIHIHISETSCARSEPSLPLDRLANFPLCLLGLAIVSIGLR